MSFTREEVAEHNDVDDCWIIYNGCVYDLSAYVRIHPGGRWIILNHAGGDATEGYNKQMHSEVADSILNGMKIGRLTEATDKP
jgi:cytochrome b involved in lipid metabolism